MVIKHPFVSEEATEDWPINAESIIQHTLTLAVGQDLALSSREVSRSCGWYDYPNWVFG